MHFYVAGMPANFVELKDALAAAAEQAIRSYDEQTVVCVTDYPETHYTYCVIRKGEQA